MISTALNLFAVFINILLEKYLTYNFLGVEMIFCFLLK